MTKDMTTGSPLKCILSFCFPLLIGNLFQQFYNLADSILVGRILGLNAFAGVGVTGALNFLILGFALGVCSGLSIPIAQSFGAGRMDIVKQRTAQLVLLGFGISAVGCLRQSVFVLYVYIMSVFFLIQGKYSHSAINSV